MHPNTHQLILFLAFLAICSGSVSQLEDKDLQGPHQDPITAFGSLFRQFHRNISQYSPYTEISQSLGPVETSWEEFQTRFRETYEKKKMLGRTSTLNNSLLLNPTKHEETVKQNVKYFGTGLQELQTSLEALTQKINQIPINILTDGQGKEFKELNHQIDYLRGEAESCSDEYLKLLDTFQKTEHKNNISLSEIKQIDEFIQLRTNHIQKNNDRIKVINEKSQEEVKQLGTKFNGIQSSYQTEKIDEKKAELKASEEKIRNMDENLVELNTKLLELRATENQDPSTFQNIEEEVQRITENLKSEKQEKTNIMKMIDDLSTEGAPLLHDESITNKESLSHLQKLDEEKNKYVQENEKMQLEISNLSSQRDKIPTFTAILEDLKQRIAIKKGECNNIQENIEEKKKERDLLLDNKTLEVGVLTQQELIKEWGKIIELKQSCLELMKYELSKFRTDQTNLENFLQASFKSLEEDMEENPDIYLATVYDNESCQESLDCLKEIFIHKLPETNFNTRVPLLTHLSAIFTRTDNISSLFKDGNNKLPEEIRNLMKAKYLDFKRSLWSLTSIFQYILDNFFDSNSNLFVKVGEEEFEIEMIKMEAVYRDIINRMKKDYQMFRVNRWKSKLEEEIHKFSSSNMLTGLNELSLTHSP